MWIFLSAEPVVSIRQSLVDSLVCYRLLDGLLNKYEIYSFEFFESGSILSSKCQKELGSFFYPGSRLLFETTTAFNSTERLSILCCRSNSSTRSVLCTEKYSNMLRVCYGYVPGTSIRYVKRSFLP
jgi:hypothetical protein